MGLRPGSLPTAGAVRKRSGLTPPNAGPGGSRPTPNPGGPGAGIGHGQDRAGLVTISAALSRALHPLAILGQRNFALVWSSNMLSAMGNQTEVLVLGWLVLTTTDSPLYVGLVTAARLGLNPLALFAGAVVDRLPRFLILAVVETIMGLLSLLMLVLLLFEALQVWQIFAITIAGGLARIFQMPAAQSLAADAVTPDRIANSVALTTTGMNITLIVGPLLGGIMFRETGPRGPTL